MPDEIEMTPEKYRQLFEAAGITPEEFEKGGAVLVFDPGPILIPRGTSEHLLVATGEQAEQFRQLYNAGEIFPAGEPGKEGGAGT
jgi:hypothetical protein